MGLRGPAPTPTQLRLLRGDKPSQINQQEPIARDGLPEPPADMSPEMREIWDFTVGELAHMRVASTADRDALVCYCEAVVNHRRASKIIAESGVLVDGLHGKIKNPALGVQEKAAQLIRSLASQFGLTPSGRSSIRTEGGRGDDTSTGNPFAASVG